MYNNKLNLKLLFYFVFGKAIWNIFIRLLKVAHCKKGQFHHLKHQASETPKNHFFWD